jgi:hypothetical protein
MITYCYQQEIRREQGASEIYLLRRKQMNGDHAELFSYALYQELSTMAGCMDVAPIKVDSYESVSKTDFEPCVWLSFTLYGDRVNLALYSSSGSFRLRVMKAELTKTPQVESVLKNESGFSESGNELGLTSSRSNVHAVLKNLAQRLAALANSNVK